MLSATIGGPTQIYMNGNAPFVGMSNVHDLMQPFNYATPVMLGCQRIPMWFVGGVGRKTPDERAAIADELVAHLRVYLTGSLKEADLPRPVHSASLPDGDDGHEHGHA